MVTIKNLTRRLGNQLFQIAAAYSLAYKFGQDFYLPQDWEYAKYFKKKHRVLNNPAVEYIWKENGFHYTGIPFLGNTAIDGYFQSEKYFINMTDIEDLFDFTEEVEAFSPNDGIAYMLSQQYKGYAEYCSIHVRRGDYLNLSEHHSVLPLSYYKEAMGIAPVNNFIVFSDDIEWCKKEFSSEEFMNYEIIFCEGRNDISDLWLMSVCAHNIIANSTFSWWGAMLNKNPNQTVISPSKDQWHGFAYANWNHDDLLPTGWIQLKY